MFLDKAFDHYKKLHRSGAAHIAITSTEDCYWMIDGYSAHKVPKNLMELNPEIFKSFPGDIMDMVAKADAGDELKSTGLVKKENMREILPFVSAGANPFTIWFNKKLLDTFPKEITLVGTEPLKPASVKYLGDTIGLILPIRHPKDDISLFL